MRSVRTIMTDADINQDGFARIPWCSQTMSFGGLSKAAGLDHCKMHKLLPGIGVMSQRGASGGYLPEANKMGTMDRETQQNYTSRFLICTFGNLPEPGMQNALLACACYCGCHVRVHGISRICARKYRLPQRAREILYR
jgi:hypothetical protein